MSCMLCCALEVLQHSVPELRLFESGGTYDKEKELPAADVVPVSVGVVKVIGVRAVLVVGMRSDRGTNYG